MAGVCCRRIGARNPGGNERRYAKDTCDTSGKNTFFSIRYFSRGKSAVHPNEPRWRFCYGIHASDKHPSSASRICKRRPRSRLAALKTNGLAEIALDRLLLGIDQEAAWEEVHAELAGGKRVLIVTDGVCETSDSNGRMFGRERIGELLSLNRDASLDSMIELLRKALQEHRDRVVQTDDVTALVLEIDHADDD